MGDEARTANDEDHPVTPIPSEHLREQLFAACGYALACAAVVFGLLTARLGRLGFISGIVLTGVLVPVNLSLIRRFARLRRSLTRIDAVAPRGRGERAVARQRSQR
ncbi:hypothetical protein KDK95_30720 [Actinospica sp. MGRD01-02]|uniref:Uncharacterized protein n=1 Tax=Actinospica acidithermotolerans TaxID=2828514 RepID=A0A941EFW6_9ACTN|nr:hypothetical protein [Actinospica acidithermotolerans]MBR7830716.1 hypothetical protein [Actinospica acidithermotolerans]